MRALHVHVTGVVQGVGFRPFVYDLAVRLGLRGWVRNSSEGVFAVVEGEPGALEEFARRIRDDAPPMAVVDSVTAREVAVQGFEAFRIEESEVLEGAMTLVSPDIATCDPCLREMRDPSDRRYRYPFVNCTNCGPRFTIIADVPYDRPSTSMRDFPMCEECGREYGDPSDRRFHAQPDACFVCGPRLYLNPSSAASVAMDADWVWSPDRQTAPRLHRDLQTERARSGGIIDRAAELLADGGTLALKGLGGFQLVCDATSEAAVARLRGRKRRWGKPLAVMAQDLEAARALARIDDAEADLLASTARPILLARRGGSDVLAPSVAPGVAEIGLMLPYTPLHHLLLEAVGRPVVMTSGNLSDEPIATGNSEALERLDPIADAFLLHDREILSRYDDSVTRVVGGSFQSVRRARGYAPFPLRMPVGSDVDILAVGPEQKNTFTLVRGDLAFVSQHIGDMENAQTLESFEETIALYERLFRVTPGLVAHDLHPEYLSTKHAMRLDLPRVGVQHHHAHIASVMAENDVRERVVGVAFDGTGYGVDGTIWGGEVLLADTAGFERFAHLRAVPMPGGVAAIRRPARMAVGTLASLGLLEHPGAATLRARLAEGEEEIVLRMVERAVNTPLTSSMGRLFDAVSALAGVRDDALYEGQAAVELEAIADLASDGAYRFAMDGAGPLVIDPAPVLEAALDDLARGVQPSMVSARFHRAVVDAVVRVAALAADAAHTADVALAGGVFMNRILLEGSMVALGEAGLTPLVHRDLPSNDAAVSHGQAFVACSKLLAI